MACLHDMDVETFVCRICGATKMEILEDCQPEQRTADEMLRRAYFLDREFGSVPTEHIGRVLMYLAMALREHEDKAIAHAPQEACKSWYYVEAAASHLRRNANMDPAERLGQGG